MDTSAFQTWIRTIKASLGPFNALATPLGLVLGALAFGGLVFSAVMLGKGLVGGGLLSPERARGEDVAIARRDLKIGAIGLVSIVLLPTLLIIILGLA